MRRISPSAAVHSSRNDGSVRSGGSDRTNRWALYEQAGSVVQPARAQGHRQFGRELAPAHRVVLDRHGVQLDHAGDHLVVGDGRELGQGANRRPRRSTIEQAEPPAAPPRWIA
jgi:hypothetical protein